VSEVARANDTAPGTSTGEGSETTSGSFTVAQIQGLVAPGADAPVTIGFNSAIEGTATGLTQNGLALTWGYVDATYVQGVIGGNVIFTLTRNGSSYDFTLLDNIDSDSDNTTGTSDSFTTALSLAGGCHATASDGDK